MIIMINGAFGVGKTTIAYRLQKELDNSMVYDPEEIGFMLRNVLPEEIKKSESISGDFQDFHLWKEITVEVAKHLKKKYHMNLIVPMTIRNPDYFQYIINGFKRIDERTSHFCLTGSKETIHERLRQRGEEEGNWCFQQTDLCLEAYQKYDFEEYVDTDQFGIHDVTLYIKEKLKI